MGYADQCAASERAAEAVEKVPVLEAEVSQLKELNFRLRLDLGMVMREVSGGAGDLYLKSLFKELTKKYKLDTNGNKES